MSYTPYNRSIYRKLNDLIPGLPEHLKAGKEYGKSSKSKPYMDLSYDFLHEDKPGEYIIALAHHFEQNGDLVPDPDMEIRVIPEKEIAEALSFQNIMLYQHVDSGEKTNEMLQRDLNEFLDQWLTNAIEQGHRIDLSKVREQDVEEPGEPEHKKEDELKKIRGEMERGEEGHTLGR
jgi:uncharacterized protein YqiB (DUF1249 family)